MTQRHTARGAGGYRTPAPQETGTPETWLPTDAAATFLGVSKRELQRKVGLYPLQFRRKSDRTGQRRTLHAVYNAEDLEAFRARCETGLDPKVYETQLAGGEGPPAALEPLPGDRGRLLASGSGRTFEAALAMLSTNLAGVALGLLQPGKPEPKLFMTVQEAAEWSGLPLGFLWERVHAGSIGTIVTTDGHTRKRYRISRRELEMLAEQQA